MVQIHSTRPLPTTPATFNNFVLLSFEPLQRVLVARVATYRGSSNFRK
jgi:hypothetical protein